ncbi:hypothetical protein BDV95DRAFT_649826 [Massariosphaeria phaeospora]|uniref:Uncharacterized protein n=1 Tax=Massariosphaeria phaeospora TaxID=100035 RepID=A0A7C8I6B2_9PLEO|nr:hypothetical protein BDV95DRAFT_649826 [Massariosphaeria phaeospora]
METFRRTFTCVEPFRRTILTLLRHFDIANALAALDCSLSEWEIKTHMNIMDDIFDDRSEIDVMLNLGFHIHIFGADLHTMRTRLKCPYYYHHNFQKDHQLHIFVVVSDYLRLLPILEFIPLFLYKWASSTDPTIIWASIPNTCQNVWIHSYQQSLSPQMPMSRTLTAHVLGYQTLSPLLNPPNRSIPWITLDGQMKQEGSDY